MSTDRNQSPNAGNEGRSEEYQQPTPQEKSTLGGTHNSGVTSDDPAERDEIEKKGALANIDQSQVRREEDRTAEGEA